MNNQILENLIQVRQTDVTGIIDKVEFSKLTISNPLYPINAHFIRFQNKTCRLDHFIDLLCDHIIPFCLKREKSLDIDAVTARRRYREAKQKFAHPKDPNKSGEPGELITYIFLESYLKAPKIFSKMSLKTNPQKHVNGSDGVHVRFNGSNLILHFGEAKFWQSHTSAIGDAFNSIKDFLSELKTSSSTTLLDFEINILEENLDIPDESLKEEIAKYLDPYTEERSNLQYKFCCIVGFDMPDMKSPCDSSDFEIAYIKKAKSCYDKIVKDLEADTELKALDWEFFILPFESVSEFRKKFLNAVKE